MSFFYNEDADDVRFGRIFAVIIAAIIFLPIGCSVMGVLTLPGHVATNTVQTAHDVIDKTINADNAIYNYEWFKQQYQDVEGTRAKLANANQSIDDFLDGAQPRTEWTFEDKQEYSRLRSIKLGLQNQLRQMIADYNAHASMANRNLFRTGDLPAHIDAQP